jgi:hypothetical protein
MEQLARRMKNGLGEALEKCSSVARAGESRVQRKQTKAVLKKLESGIVEGVDNVMCQPYPNPQVSNELGHAKFLIELVSTCKLR